MEKYKIKRYDEKNTRKEIKTKVLKENLFVSLGNPEVGNLHC